MSFYIDNSWKEGNVSYVWKDITRLDSIITHRKTHVEMIHRPDWGVACYMDGDIQSCELDEALYHESLVHPVMSSVVRPKRVMIVGGGEGATAREVLKWPSVEHVDMYEWDEDVVRLFQTKYPQWAKGAWEDPRLHLHFEDIFEKIMTPPEELYDVMIIDLIEPDTENMELWTALIRQLSYWIRPTGSISIYSGIRTMGRSEQPYQALTELILKQSDQNVVFYRTITPYHFFLPCFLTECTFLLLSFSPDIIVDPTIPSHLTEDIWKSYTTFNW
jgi:spermidine synthase